MSRDCSYIFLWEYGPDYGPDLMENSERAIRLGAEHAFGTFKALNDQIAFFECFKHGLVLDRNNFKYIPNQILESANGDPFHILADPFRLLKRV